MLDAEAMATSSLGTLAAGKASGLIGSLFGGGATGEGLGNAIAGSLGQAIDGSGSFGKTLGMTIGAAAGGPAGAAIGATVSDILMSGFNQIVDKAVEILNSIDPRLGGAGASALGAAGTAATAALFTPALLMGPIAAVAVPLAALGAGFMALAKETEGYARTMSVFKLGVDLIINAIEPFGNALMPFAGLFVKFASAMSPLVTQFSLLSGGVLPLLFNAAKSVAWVLSTIAIVGQRLNILFTDFGIWIAENITHDDDRAAELEALKAEQWERLSALKAARDSMSSMSFAGSAKHAAFILAEAMGAAAGATEEYTETLNQSTLNLPAGYRMQRNVYESSGYGQGMAAGAGPNPTTLIVNIERVEASDPEQLVDALNRASELRAGKVRGGSMFFPVWGAGG